MKKRKEPCRSCRIRRRRFLQIGVTAAGAIGGYAGCRSKRPALAEEERQILIALVDQILPGDQDPGGVELGVVDFIERQLQGPYRRHFPAYREGLAAMEKIGRDRFRKGFGALSAADRLALLTEIDRGNAPPKTFFYLVVGHAMQGYYGNPRHGGNREFLSWRMLGVDSIPIRGRRLYDMSSKETGG